MTRSGDRISRRCLAGDSDVTRTEHLNTIMRGSSDDNRCLFPDQQQQRRAIIHN
jgi:hypothetical protein